ncbi:uncharacterized protein LOC131164147 [Malania oleifera]|uniref:uncharacterized protein LOC131164147 n=1 Tax=Malania oleifera TaxID=397392 RepID=UPI0025AEB58A|nr:uncharacterized protein LOC131164147 [Malania oleifera]
MAANFGFPCQALGKGLYPKARASLTLGPAPVPFKRTCQLHLNKVTMQPQITSVGCRTDYKFSSGGKLHLVMTSRSNSELWPSPTSPAKTVEKFYKCINEKNIKQLPEFISEDCCFDDCAFPMPIQGKEEVVQFFDQLIRGMGENLKFRVCKICEGDSLIAGINWHLEWKGIQVPFTRGCSFFECSQKEETLLIKKAQVVIESPFKPGVFALVLLKTMTSLFDSFPSTAECMSLIFTNIT